MFCSIGRNGAQGPVLAVPNAKDRADAFRVVEALAPDRALPRLENVIAQQHIQMPEFIKRSRSIRGQAGRG